MRQDGCHPNVNKRILWDGCFLFSKLSKSRREMKTLLNFYPKKFLVLGLASY